MNDDLLKHCQPQGGIAGLTEGRKNWDEIKEGTWRGRDPALAIFPFHEVGGSCDSRELAEVGTSEVEQLGRRGVTAEVAPGSGTGAGQGLRPALSEGLPALPLICPGAQTPRAPSRGPIFSLGK